MDTSPLIETWRMSHAVNIYLLERIPDEALGYSYAPRVRTVGGQFSHIHNVRIMWLKSSAPKLSESVKSFEKEALPSKKELLESLEQSAKVMETFLTESAEKGKVKNWKHSPISFLGYVIAHEAHHRGLAMVALRAGGFKLPQADVFGMWEWGKLAQ